MACPETPLAVYKLDGYFGTLESRDGWVYFASLLMDRVSLLVLNLKTLASTITTIPVEVRALIQQRDLYILLDLAGTVHQPGRTITPPRHYSLKQHS